MMTDVTDLGAFLDHGWQRLLHGVAEASAPARHPVLATVSPEGQPEARTVVLRAADRSLSRLECHTDLGSAKVASLRACPSAELHVWDAEARLQLRLRGQVRIATGAEAASRWPGVPVASRAAYGARPAPGMPIDHPFAYDKPGDAAGFAVLWCDLTRIDLMELADRHRRAFYHRAAPHLAWQGQWVSP